MIMKTLTINGQTFIVVDADAMKKIADSDLDMNGRIIRNVLNGNEDTDAATVGQLNAAVVSMATALDSKTGYVTLAETILTEDVNEIIWTKGDNDEVLRDYKDFFIYWVGKFDVATTGKETWICRANGGGIYFSYNYINKQTSRTGFWFDIHEIARLPDGNALYKTTYPENALDNFNIDFSYLSQGLIGNNKTVISDISTGTYIEEIRFGSLSSGSKMVAGSKAILLGRKR